MKITMTDYKLDYYLFLEVKTTKQENTEIKRELAKQFLNNLYGIDKKFIYVDTDSFKESK